MSLVTAMIYVGLSGAITYGLFTLMDFQNKGVRREAYLDVASEIYGNIVHLISATGARADILGDPANAEILACLLETPISCKNGQVLGPINVRSPFSDNGTVPYVRAEASGGFTINGQSCNEFSMQNGNDRCPLRLEVYATVLCLTKDCISATLKYTVKALESSSQGQFAFNTSTFDQGRMLSANSISAKIKCFKLRYGVEFYKRLDLSAEFESADSELLSYEGAASVIQGDPAPADGYWGVTCYAPWRVVYCGADSSDNTTVGALMRDNQCVTDRVLEKENGKYPQSISIEAMCCNTDD